MISVAYDERLGVVRVGGSGFLSVSDEAKAAAAAAEAMARCRAEHGDLKVLVDCSSYVQDPAVMEAAKGRRHIATERYDRIAFVFTTSLAKMQASRYFRAANRQCFVSEHAALTWLLADRGAARVEVA
jgi:hypothetical protein